MTERGNISRREALKGLSAAALATLAGSRPAAADSSGLSFERPGVQLYTLRSEMQNSVDRTLARVAQIGYREVEFAGYFGKTPTQIDVLLKNLGLAAPSAHVDRNTLGVRWQKTLDDARAAGHTYLVVAFVPEADRRSVGTYQRLAAEFNKAGEAGKSHEITFAYHNHDFEFAPLGGTNGHAVLLRECDPALVKFELDLYWVAKAGRDPVAYITQNPNRFALVHLKDMASDGSITEVGSGTIDFQKAFDAGKHSISHFFVEHDQPQGAFESITKSLSAIRRYR
ncbi:MAG: sugar phosphate isomerase/epimerase family protein [Gemmatimonadaceae bacterium]